MKLMIDICKILRLMVITIPILPLLVSSIAIGEDNSSLSSTLEEKAARITSPAHWLEILTVEETIELFHQFLNEVLDSTGELRPGVEDNIFSNKVGLAAMVLAGYYEFHLNDDISGLIDQWGEPVNIYQVKDDSSVYGLPADLGKTLCYEYPDIYVWRLQSTGGPIILSGSWMITPRSERLDSYLEKYVFDTESPEIKSIGMEELDPHQKPFPHP